MTTPNDTARTGHESEESFTEKERTKLTDGGAAVDHALADDREAPYPTRQLSFPVTVPEHIEESARERMEQMRDAPEDHEYRPDFEGRTEAEILETFLLDHYDLNPQFLTRDVEHEEYNRPVTRAVYGCLTWDQYRLVEKAAHDQEMNVQQFVRRALLDAVPDALLDPAPEGIHVGPTRGERMQLLLDIIGSLGPIGPDDLHATYAGQVEDPVGKRALRYDLEKLQDAGAVVADGVGPSRTYDLAAED